jgi:hypothetical protein
MPALFNDHLHALGDECLDDRQADPAGGSGHDGGASFELVHVGHDNAVRVERERRVQTG